MITEIKQYFCEGTPKDEDILQAIEIAANNKCLVELHWSVVYSGRYRMTVSESDTLDSVKKFIPKYYGI